MKHFRLQPIALVLLLMLAFSAVAQRTLTLDDIYNPNHYPAQMRDLQWVGGSNQYAWPELNNLMVSDVSKKSDAVMVQFSDFNEDLEAAGLGKMRRFPNITWMDETTFRFNYGTTLVTYNVKTRKVTKLHTMPEGAENTTLEPTTLAEAYTIGDNLYVLHGDDQVQVTTDGGNGIVNGQYVHRREFGISNGIFWSPKGNLLAFYRKDESMVTSYPLVDISQRVAGLKEVRYPMAGMTSEQVTVGVYHLATGKTTFLQTGEPAEQYLTNITWSPDEQWIYIAVLNRGQNHMKLNRYNAATGAFDATLFEEKSDFYVEPLNGLLFLPNNPNQFIWQSQRNSWNHLYLYDTKGTLLKRYTSGDWMVTDIQGFDKSGDNLYFYSTAESPLERHLYQLDLKRDRITRITTVKGRHQVQPSADGKYFIDQYSNATDIVNQIDLTDTKGKVLKTLLQNQDPLHEFDKAEIRMGTLKADDGTTLYYRMILPPGFDPQQKYPVFYYVYGGPHVQLINDSWLGNAGLFLTFMAHQGYVVFTLDNRGSANRGFAFESVIHRKLGILEAEDQYKGIAFLLEQPFVDTERIGIQGWSYGGFMTINLMQRYPDVFKAGIAGGPVIDWKFYEVMYGERYMDTPEENPMGYTKTSLLNGIDSLQGRLLIIQGDMDDVVVMQNSLSYIKKCIEKKKQVEYFIYPGHEHNVSGPDRHHLHTKIFNFMEESLK